MIAKVVLFLAGVAAVPASVIGGIGSPILGVGHLGLVSAQTSRINHVSPVGVITAPLAIGHGIAASPLALGLGVGPLVLGHGLAAGNARADGITGHGIVGSRYGGVIAHNAIVGHGIVGGVHGGLLALGHGIGH